MALVDTGNYQQADQILDRALQINPNDFDSINNKGCMLNVLERHAEAIPWFDKAASIRPDDHEVYKEKGDAL